MSESNRNPSRTPEAVLRRLEWTVIRRLDGVLHGDYRTLFRGHGLDLADLREYMYGDDVRHIDWNVTARLPHPYVREYNEEREVAAWFLLDLSASVNFGSQELKKQAVSSEFVAVLARILTRHGNRVGALFYGDRVDKVIPTRSGRRQVLHLLHSMANRPERAQSRRDGPGRAPAHRLYDGAAAFAHLHRLGLHQRAGMGRAARASCAAARRRRGAPLRSAGNGAAGYRHAGRAGRRNGRADLRRHARSRRFAGGSRRPPRRARPSFAPRSPPRVWTRSNCRRTTISSTPSCASPTCASDAPSSRPAAASRSTSECTRDLAMARNAVAAGARTGGRRRVRDPAAAEEEDRASLREPFGDERRARRESPAAPPRPAAHVPRRVHADDPRHRAPRGGGHAAVAARNGDPFDGRLGQHARDRCEAEPHRRRAGRGACVRCRAAEDHANRRRLLRRHGVGRAIARRTAAKTSWPPSSASSSSAEPRWAAGSWSR